MRLAKGHKYLRGPGNDIIPYNAIMHKAAPHYEIYIPTEDIVNDHQLKENEGIKAASVVKAAEILRKEGDKPQLLKGKFEHQDIREEMKNDLAS